MWLFLPDAFISVVQDRDQAEILHVRARDRADLARLFPGARVYATPGADYPFRVRVSRAALCLVIEEHVINKLTYPNFKDAVDDRARHDAYLGVWREMRAWQDGRRRPRPRAVPRLEDFRP